MDKIILTGTVEHGKKLGTFMNMPTANIVPNEDITGIAYGVYYSSIKIDGTQYKSISNIGVKPTVSNNNRVGVETFIYDFGDDLYDRDVEITLYEFKRPEMKFDSIDALMNQMRDDLKAGSTYNPGSH